jgi:hypothetical protein
MNHLYTLMNLSDDAYNMRYVSSNRLMTWNLVRERPDIQWNYQEMTKNPNITMDIINNNRKYGWDQEILAKNPNITPEQMAGWYAGTARIMKNPNLTWEFIEKYPEEEWDFGYLSKKHFITWEIVLSNLGKLWNFDKLCYNPNITWDMIKDHRKQYRQITKNPNITWDIIKDNPDYSFCVDYMLSNPTSRVENATYTRYMNLPMIMYNPNLKWSDVIYNQDDDFVDHTKVNIAKNKFNGWNAASKIQHLFRRWINNVVVEVTFQSFMSTVYIPNELGSLIFDFVGKYEVPTQGWYKPSIEKEIKKAYILFYEVGESLWYPFEVTKKEYWVLEKEVHMYNNWMNEVLFKGLAPTQCYVTEHEDTRINLLSISKIYEGINIINPSSNRSTYEIYHNQPYKFDIVDEYDGGFEPKETYKLDKQSLINIITKPYDEYDSFSIGYSILPLTKKLLEEEGKPVQKIIPPKVANLGSTVCFSLLDIFGSI